MRLDSLTLENFRGFEKLEIGFDPGFTVLLGGNMAGKTAVLAGAQVALGALLRWSVHPMGLGEIQEQDIRRELLTIEGVPELMLRLPAKVRARGVFDGVRHDWQRTTRASPDAQPEPGEPVGNPIGEAIGRRTRSADVVGLPVIAGYWTQRGALQEDVLAEVGPHVGSRADGYHSAFDTSIAMGSLAAWLRRQTLVQLQRGGNYRQPQLAAVVAAVSSALDGVRTLWYDVQYEEIRVGMSDGDIQSFAMLSEGYRNVLATVADLAWRASVLNPQHGERASELAEGVVLIDELELHLHPAWQRRIVEDLRRTFPKIQFIVTTHSPQIVASVKRSQVRLLENNRLVADQLYVEGRDTNGLLEDVFGVPARPADVEAEVRALYRLIEDEAFEAAQAALQRLQERLGPDDVAIVRARWMLETEMSDREQAAAPAP